MFRCQCHMQAPLGTNNIRGCQRRRKTVSIQDVSQSVKAQGAGSRERLRDSSAPQRWGPFVIYVLHLSTLRLSTQNHPCMRLLPAKSALGYWSFPARGLHMHIDLSAHPPLSMRHRIGGPYLQVAPASIRKSQYSQEYNTTAVSSQQLQCPETARVLPALLTASIQPAGLSRRGSSLHASHQGTREKRCRAHSADPMRHLHYAERQEAPQPTVQCSSRR